MGRKKPLPSEGSAGPFNAAFAELEALKGSLEPSEPEPAPPEPASEPPAAGRSETAPSPFGPKVVVRRERKGHGGKTVTRISGLSAGPERLRGLAKDLAGRLGVGAKTEDEEIWVQGDQTQRLQDVLTQLGAKRVVIGN